MVFTVIPEPDTAGGLVELCDAMYWIQKELTRQFVYTRHEGTKNGWVVEGTLPARFSPWNPLDLLFGALGFIVTFGWFRIWEKRKIRIQMELSYTDPSDRSTRQCVYTVFTGRNLTRQVCQSQMAFDGVYCYLHRLV